MQVQKATLMHLDISPEIDCLVTIRTHDDGPWSEEKEDKAIKSHDGIGFFLIDCVANKKAVYALLKSLQLKDSTP